MTVTTEDRVIFAATEKWLELVQRAGEFDFARATERERRRVLKASGLVHWDEDCLDVQRVTRVDQRHTAIHVGDFLAFRISGGRYSVTTDVIFVRIGN